MSRSLLRRTHAEHAEHAAFLATTCRTDRSRLAYQHTARELFALAAAEGERESQSNESEGVEQT